MHGRQQHAEAGSDGSGDRLVCPEGTVMVRDSVPRP